MRGWPQVLKFAFRLKQLQELRLKKSKTPTGILTTEKVWKGTFTQYKCIGEQKQIGEKLFQRFQRILNVRNRFLKMKF